MAPTLENLAIENPLLKTFILYVSILTAKMLLMAPLTSIKRIKTKTVITSEDIVFGKKAKVGTNDEIERVRRAHRNDLENILVFMVIGLLYVMTGPNVFLASMLFRFYTIARIVHTFGYVMLGSHGVRGMAWVVGYLITAYMSVNLLISFFNDM